MLFRPSGDRLPTTMNKISKPLTDRQNNTSGYRIGGEGGEEGRGIHGNFQINRKET